MFENILKEGLTLQTALIILGISLALGILTSLTYMLTHRKSGYSDSFIMTLLILPAVISAILLLIGDNLAGAISLGGVFAIVRFRSQPADGRDMTYVFICLAIGLACGCGYVGYAAILSVILLVVIAIFSFLQIKIKKSERLSLKIVIPEDVNYDGLFDDVFAKHVAAWTLEKVKTSDFGTSFQLHYNIIVKKAFDQKNFIDDLRIKNGNLNIILAKDYLDKGL